MAKLFDIVGSEVKLDPRIIAIPSLKKLWDRDKDKAKSKAINELSFVAFLCDYTSPYRDLEEGLKQSTIIQDIFKKDWEPDQEVLEAIEKYKQLQQTPNMRLWLSAKNSADKIANYLDDVDFKVMDDFGKPVYSIKELSSTLKDVGNIVKSLQMLERQVQTELADNSVRGKSEVGAYELPR